MGGRGGGKGGKVEKERLRVSSAYPLVGWTGGTPAVHTARWTRQVLFIILTLK